MNHLSRMRSAEVWLVFRSWALQDKEEVVVLGSCAALGSWEASKAVVLTETTTPQWEATVPPSFLLCVVGMSFCHDTCPVEDSTPSFDWA